MRAICLEEEKEEIRDRGRGHEEKMTTRKEVEKKRKGANLLVLGGCPINTSSFPVPSCLTSPISRFSEMPQVCHPLRC